MSLTAEDAYTSDVIRALELQRLMRDNPGSCFMYSYLIQVAKLIANPTIRKNTLTQLKGVHQAVIDPRDHKADKSGCDIHFPRKT